jgi:serine/threonine protein kinase
MSTEALKKLSHPGIVRIIETSVEEPYYVAEYCEQGDLTKVNLSSRTLLGNFCRTERFVMRWLPLTAQISFIVT